MSLDEIEWTESEGESDENLVLNDFDQDSEDEAVLDKALSSKSSSVAGPHTTSGRTRRTRDEDLEPEVEEAYQQARNMYTQGDYDGALALLEEAIMHEANSKLLFNLLVSIHEERQDYEKALIARVAVAHLDKRDKDTWIDIAERSVALGHLAQAAVFFQHVSRLDRTNWQLLCTRAELHMQLGQLSHALTLYQRVRTKFFHLGPNVGLEEDQKTNILLNIAGTLKDLGRIEEATKIYMDIFNKTLRGDSQDPPELELDWQSLNILAELLYDQKLYTSVISIVKDGSRWLNLRASEDSFWQPHNLENDAEFDDRRTEILARADPQEAAGVSLDDNLFFLPVDIRIWLLECRLKQIPSHILLNSQSVAAVESLPCVADAVCHLAELRKCQPVDIYADLYKRAASAFFNARLYSDARELYTALTGIAHESLGEYLEMTVQVAKCEMELHNMERAEYLYTFVLARDPENQEALVALGEIYAASDRIDESQKILTRLMEIRTADDSESTSQLNQASQGNNAVPNTSRDSQTEHTGPNVKSSVFVDEASFYGRSRSANARPTRAEKAESERLAQQRADDAFAGLSRYQTGLDAGNAVATMEWLRYADELVNLFESHRKFFPATKHKELPFNGSSLASVSERIDRLRLAQEDHFDDEEENDNEDSNLFSDANNNLESVNDSMDDAGNSEEKLYQDKRNEESVIWRGQPIRVWFMVLMRCALEHARVGNCTRSEKVVNIASSASVFNYTITNGDLESKSQDIVELVGLSCAYLVGDMALVGDLIRHMQTQYQFNTQSFRLYSALLSTSNKAIKTFGSSNNQKFFLRQIKALDSIVHYKKPVSGMAKVIDPDNAPKDDDPHLLILYVYVMLLGPSYAPALTYLIRVREKLPNHPLVLLVYGVIEMHRAIQRTSLNRHHQIVEGLSFMLDYVKVRGDQPVHKLECNYNLGRFFHGIGLLTIAEQYYKKALELSDMIADEYNIGREAAYNLYLIYCENGNPDLGGDVINKYLVM
ncbi:transcription factor TFIIIC subunit [Starmerella bacillaris]|uniref:Transcription factor TFIIIC subunit n=1 Tax=Starmerella bacillaris TaxID=1247836 RepID=A0AAV5RNY1_STABA|nr:transcription factor TFIIIC subunit [Starmerella bacillaris]